MRAMMPKTPPVVREALDIPHALALPAPIAGPTARAPGCTLFQGPKTVPRLAAGVLLANRAVAVGIVPALEHRPPQSESGSALARGEEGRIRMPGE